MLLNIELVFYSVRLWTPLDSFHFLGWFTEPRMVVRQQLRNLFPWCFHEISLLAEWWEVPPSGCRALIFLAVLSAFFSSHRSYSWLSPVWHWTISISSKKKSLTYSHLERIWQNESPKNNFVVESFVVVVDLLSCVWLSATPWTVAHQAPLSVEFSRQEYWSG